MNKITLLLTTLGLASVTSFILGGHTVSISADEPESPVDGDIWIEIV